ncbi:MAG: tRNA (N6-isopentenyl adenosine(37)-C2)-methylthiotransferase MiaB [Gemmatimonadetes bacterium]|nr:tRNA (N6-isopentenyl adenosine(37)-C2)-methylthiotransferase MiaB [Gemmatimonadota bacterium]
MTPIIPRSKEMRILQPGAPAGAADPAVQSRAGTLVAPALSHGAGERRTFYLETYGCQMNDYDSEFIASRFLEEGWAPAERPETADVVLFNTCSVRQGAEDRVRARVESFAGAKRERPDMLLGVIGCMAQRLGEDLQAGNGLVDLVAGTDTYRDLPDLVTQRAAAAPGTKLVATPQDSVHTYGITNYPRPLDGPCAFLTIMQGCDKFCTFCIVPFTRGRERAKPWREVVEESRRLVERGAKQITLLGQNVNSYRDGEVEFSRLLREVDRVEGLERVHFTSSYPRDMTTEVFRAIAECRSPAEFLHFPVQSGSDRVLKRMKRRHTAEWYLRKVEEAREIIPDVQFVTDLIVGFPGETEEDFQDTLRLVREVRYAECYMYKYSPREDTPAVRLPDSVPEEEKSRRLTELIDVQRKIGMEILEEQVGREMEVLIESPSRRNPREPFGRTRNRFMVVLPEGSAQTGDLVKVRLEELRGSTFRGVPTETGE